MAYYYVKNTGTATGDAGRYTTEQVGAMDSLGVGGFYANVSSAIAATTTPVAGDYILVSDLSNSNTSGLLWSTAKGVMIISVDDANINQSRTLGNFGRESTLSGDIIFTDTFVSGFVLSVGDDSIFGSDNTINDSKIVSGGGSGDTVLVLTGDGSSATLNNTELNTPSSIFSIRVAGGGKLYMYGGSVTSDTNNAITLTNGGFNNGGGLFYAKGVDLSGVTGTLIANAGSDAVNDDTIDVNFDMCKIAAGVAFTNEVFKSYNQRALFTRCSADSVSAEYQYHLHAFGGDVDDDDSVYRNEDPAYTDSGQKISYRVETNTDASLTQPLWFDLPVSTWAQLSTAQNTVRLFITSDLALTNKDIYFAVIYNDSISKQTPKVLSSAPVTAGGTLDLMATGAELVTDGVSTWTGGLANNYLIDLQLPDGSDVVPIIRVYCTIPSSTMHINSIPVMV